MEDKYTEVLERMLRYYNSPISLKMLEDTHKLELVYNSDNKVVGLESLDKILSFNIYGELQPEIILMKIFTAGITKHREINKMITEMDKLK